MSEEWYVTVRGEQSRRYIACDSTSTDADFLYFLDADGKPLLVVRKSEIITLERYQEPPF